MNQPVHADAADRREIRAVFLGLMMVLGLSAIDQNIVNTALPRIVSDLGGIGHLSWVVTSYVLTSTSTMPLYGKLSDQFGRKPMISVAILMFLVGSALSGAAQTLGELIAFRAVQGIGAGGLLPLSQIIIGELVPPAQRGRRQGAVASVFAVCSIVGPVLGGVITDLLSWHWIFYVNLPIGAVALVMITRALTRPHPRRQQKIDYRGALLLTAASTAFLLTLALGGTELPWASYQIEGLAVTAATLALLFVLHIRGTSDPVLPPHLFGNRLFVIACAVMSLSFMGLAGSGLLFPLFFQMVMGIRPSYAGLLTSPLMIGMVISSIFNGRVLLRSGRYKPAQIFGLAMATAALSLLAWCAAESQGLTLIEPSVFALGLGIGLVMPNMTIAVQNALAPVDLGIGTATLAFLRSLGGLVGVAGSGAILAHNALFLTARTASATGAAPLAVYRHAVGTTFTLGTAIVALALATLMFLPELPLRGHDAGPK